MTRLDPLTSLAPDIDPQWREDFVIELRLQGVAGSAIAEALTEAQTHCRDSRQDAASAFGPPVDYARSLDMPDESGWTLSELARTWAQLLLILGGTSLSLQGAFALLLTPGDRVEISVGTLVSAGAVLVVMVLAFALGDRLLRLFVDHAVWSTVLCGAVVAGVVAIGMPFKNLTLGTVPALATLLSGLVALGLWGLVAALGRRSGHTLDDPLSPPSPSPRHSD